MSPARGTARSDRRRLPRMDTEVAGVRSDPSHVRAGAPRRILPPAVNGSGPKGIRTSDLLAASQADLNGVLTRGKAGQKRAKPALLLAESPRPVASRM